ncbi:MAG: putative virulence factor, partial [Acetobacteraceae bacterium]|nr:putative virulence factor [Acetobacteraceae bacterium]
MEFEEKLGATEVGEGEGQNRWSARIQANITSFLALDHSWPLEWTPGQPFANTFWLRNPNFVAKGLLDYDENRREIGVREPERMAKRRAEFIATEAVRRHFADPGLAWDEAMKLNDGGVTHLAARLAPVCNPALKRGQVAARLAVLAKAMAQRLDPFHVSDDREAERTKRRAEGAAAARAMAAAAAAQRFGLMLRAMMVDAEALQAAFTRLVLSAPEEAASAPIVGAAVAEADLAGELAGLFGEEAAPAAAPARATDMADRMAEAALETWGERLGAFTEDPATTGFLRLTREAAVFIATQVETGAATRGLREEMAKRIRALSGFHERLSDSLTRPVMVAERAINDHVAWLGFEAEPEAQRPKVQRDGRAVFAAREAAEDIPALGPTPAPFETTFTIDWITAFAKLVDLNVDHAFGGRVDSEANARLGRLLASLRAAL